MIKIIAMFGLFTLNFLLSSCSKGFNSAEELYKWMKDPANGMLVTKQSGDKQLDMKYLPVEFLVYKEMKDKSTRNKNLTDSLTKIYSGSRSFLLTIKYKNDDQYDPLYEGISDFSEFKSRKEDMQFSFDQYVELHTAEGHVYKPVLSHMEDTYGLQKFRNIYLVFAPDNSKQADILNSAELDLVFDDMIFNTGIHHFVFQKKNIDKKLILNFIK
jgi:hypothetical protein